MEIDIVRDDRDSSGSYALLVGGRHVGELNYVERDGVRTFTHTGVAPELRGQGLAARLVERAMADARTDDVAVLGACSYVADFLDQHPEHADLVVR